MATYGAEKAVHAALNFAVANAAESIWSNEDSTQVQQALVPFTVAIHDARRAEPSLQAEGFTITHAPIRSPRWTDADWLEGEYLPFCLDLVKRLSGAALVFPYGRVPTVRMASIEEQREAKAAPPARFVHIDQTPESAEPFVRAAAGDADLTPYRRCAIFNVWRSISAPPQNTPLAICDKRTVKREQLATGLTVSARFPQGIPYVASMHSPTQRWNYFPEVAMEESIVFKGVGLGDDEEIGCLHSAFDLPDPNPGAPPRASVEARVLAFFP